MWISSVTVKTAKNMPRIPGCREAIHFSVKLLERSCHLTPRILGDPFLLPLVAALLPMAHTTVVVTWMPHRFGL